jgi:hypothetical protein
MTAKKKVSPRDKAPAKNKPHAKRSAAAGKPAAGSDSSTAKVVHTLLRPLAPLDATTRAALRSLATDAHRSELGRQTKARGVLAEGVAMAVTIDQALTTFPNLSELYPATRFAHFSSRSRRRGAPTKSCASRSRAPSRSPTGGAPAPIRRAARSPTRPRWTRW